MLITSVVLYLMLTIGIGLYAARRVSNTKDFLVAGRSLPLYINVATVFATWFGAETVLSVSATFAKDGAGGVVGDPFGATACLMFVAIFFARAFYRLDLLTIGDFFKKRYNRPVEVATGIAITASYLGWCSAQLTALGLVIFVLGGGQLTLSAAIIIGTAIVLCYTIWGGMWSVAFTDLLQSLVILFGLSFVAYLVGDLAGGASKVIQSAQAADKFKFWPTGGTTEWLAFIAAFLTFALGSIPQQDVFQRVTSAKDEKTAVRGTMIGATIYFIFAFVPIFIALAALVLDPNVAKLFAAEDQREVQRILPDLILAKTPVWAQILFFGALLSAILSTASGTLLAPTAVFTENVIRPFAGKMKDAQFLKLLRVVLLCFALAVLMFALNSKSTMYEMVQNAYKVTLVGAFVPLAFGMYYRAASSQGAVFSIAMGLGFWLLGEASSAGVFGDAVKAQIGFIPAQLIGLAAAIAGMLLGSHLPQFVADNAAGRALVEKVRRMA